MHDLPLSALRALAAIHETGGVRPAARRLQVSHAAVSRHLRELEGWLGVKLLEGVPGRKVLAFTPAGEALGQAASRHMNALDQAVATVRERRRGNGVTISTTASLAARWLLPRLPRLSEIAPWVEVSVVIQPRLSDPAADGADLSLRMGNGPWPDLVCEPLMDDALYPVMSPAYWNAKGEPEALADLTGMSLLHDRDPNAAWTIWRAAHGPAALDVRSGPRFSSSDLVLRAAAENLGVALARDRLVEHDLVVGSLIRPFGDAQVCIPNAYWIVQPAVPHTRAALDAVLGWLRDAPAPSP